MTTFFVADTHFGHARVLDHMPNRRAWGDTIEAHDRHLIEQWNAVVSPSDTVWHLGDFALDKSAARRVRPQLNGSIHLVIGNHDAQAKIDRLDGLWASANDAKYLRLDGDRIYLHHYACRVWRRSNHGSFHLFGHSHGHMRPHGRSMDVGVDVLGYPCAWGEIRAMLLENPSVNHHGDRAGEASDFSREARTLVD